MPTAKAKKKTQQLASAENQATEFANTIQQIRTDILGKRTSLPACAPQQAANYLLAFAEPPPTTDRKGICYYSLPISIDFNKTPAAKQHSEHGDGIFKPLKVEQSKSLTVALKQLEEVGIPIESCEQNFVEAFLKDDGFYKIVFYSFSKSDVKFTNNVDISAGRQFQLLGTPPNNIVVSFVGLNIHDEDRIRTIFHELGHSLNFNHFPPGFGDFDVLCAPEFYNNVSQIKTTMQANPCVVNTPSKDDPSSVMFCDLHNLLIQEDGFELPEGDQIAFKTQYDKMIKKTANKKTNSRSTKDELAIKTSNHRSILSSFLPKISFFSASNISGLLAPNANLTTNFWSFSDWLTNGVVIASGISAAAYLYYCYSSNQLHTKTDKDSQIVKKLESKFATLQKNYNQLEFTSLKVTGFFDDLFDFFEKSSKIALQEIKLFLKSDSLSDAQLKTTQKRLERLEEILNELTRHQNKLQELEQQAEKLNNMLTQKDEPIPQFGVFFNTVSRELYLETSYKNEDSAYLPFSYSF